ncbi:MAG: DNA polymerase/3'-5' exonuclease PolX [Candidatus Eisenbacteria bacterium]|nr:DNA polymerase/3'-5' exonuclease PolX [Candidatus Eisenbacteria bacterium]
MTIPDGAQAARLLEETAVFLELAGESSFKSRAYARAARAVQNLSAQELSALARGEGPGVPGIGKGLRSALQEIAATGTLADLRELKSRIPPGVLEILDVPGLGPRKARRLWTELDVTTPGELEYACQENRLTALPGFGAKSQQKILDGLQWRRRMAGWHLRSKAEAAWARLKPQLAGLAGVREIAVAGDVRRAMEIVQELVLVAAADDPAAASAAAAVDAGAQIADGTARWRTTEGVPVALSCVPPENFGRELWRRTGHADHVRDLEELAAARGVDLAGRSGSTGVTREAEIYRRLDLPVLPPPLRESSWRRWMENGGTPPALLQAEDLRGVLHVHTTWSDGGASLEEMVAAASQQGWTYIGIADHSRSAFYANGLDASRLRAQRRAVEQLRPRFPSIEIWHGCEVDILADGALDFPDDVLEELDFAIGSVHSRLTMPAEEMTRRLIAAVRHPWMDMLGHPTGRLLLGRETAEPDLEAILAAAAESGTIVEFNANPYRQDLDWRWIPRARELGALLSINPDSHAAETLTDMSYGARTASKGGLTAAGTFNARPPAEARLRLKRNTRPR